jgi:hypothetical protein
VQVAVDVFVTAQGYVDVTSLSVLPRLTGGSLYSYQPFNAAVDSAKLFNDLRWNLTRPQGLEAVMRVRCSQVRTAAPGGARGKRIGRWRPASTLMGLKELNSALTANEPRVESIEGT